MLTLAQQDSAIITGLTNDQKVEAAGHFSSLKTLAPNDIVHLLGFFNPNITGWTRQLILNGPSCAAVLYYEDCKFHLLSSPLLVIGPDNTVCIVCHDGDSLAHMMPISIKASNAVLEVLVLVFPPVVGTAALEDLMVHNTINDPIANKEPFPFPVIEEGDAALVFVSVCVASISLLIPLPMGHAMDSVALNNAERIDEMIAKLMAISPIYAEWAQSMAYTGKHFNNKSLDVETVAVPEIYFNRIDFTALLCGSIHTKSSRVDVTSTEGKAVLTRIKAAKKTNMETWFGNNQVVYQALLSAIMHTVPTAVSPQVIVKTQTRADKQEEGCVLKGAMINSLILVREDDIEEGAPILLMGELDESFKDTLSKTPRNACKDYVQLFCSKIEHMRDSPAVGIGAMAYVTRFPMAAIDVAFSLALQKGQWSDQPVQVEGLLLG
jgi:hypothetical protein